MILYKNVDICDLESIFDKGIISIDDGATDNWEEGNRADNPTDVVYLFKPSGKANAFPKYGLALLEVDCDASENALAENDIHKGDYIEYITKNVPPEKIKSIYVPSVFKDRIQDCPIIDKITFVAMEAGTYDIKPPFSRRPATETELDSLGKHSPLSSSEYMFFRGLDEKRNVIDFYDVKYLY